MSRESKSPASENDIIITIADDEKKPLLTTVGSNNSYGGLADDYSEEESNLLFLDDAKTANPEEKTLPFDELPLGAKLNVKLYQHIFRLDLPKFLNLVKFTRQQMPEQKSKQQDSNNNLLGYVTADRNRFIDIASKQESPDYRPTHMLKLLIELLGFTDKHHVDVRLTPQYTALLTLLIHTDQFNKAWRQTAFKHAFRQINNSLGTTDEWKNYAAMLYEALIQADDIDSLKLLISNEIPLPEKKRGEKTIFDYLVATAEKNDLGYYLDELYQLIPKDNDSAHAYRASYDQNKLNLTTIDEKNIPIPTSNTYTATVHTAQYKSFLQTTDAEIPLDDPSQLNELINEIMQAGDLTSLYRLITTRKAATLCQLLSDDKLKSDNEFKGDSDSKDDSPVNVDHMDTKSLLASLLFTQITPGDYCDFLIRNDNLAELTTFFAKGIKKSYIRELLLLPYRLPDQVLYLKCALFADNSTIETPTPEDKESSPESNRYTTSVAQVDQGYKLHLLPAPQYKLARTSIISAFTTGAIPTSAVDSEVNKYLANRGLSRTWRFEDDDYPIDPTTMPVELQILILELAYTKADTYGKFPAIDSKLHEQLGGQNNHNYIISLKLQISALDRIVNIINQNQPGTIKQVLGHAVTKCTLLLLVMLGGLITAGLEFNNVDEKGDRIKDETFLFGNQTYGTDSCDRMFSFDFEKNHCFSGSTYNTSTPLRKLFYQFCNDQCNAFNTVNDIETGLLPVLILIPLLISVGFPLYCIRRIEAFNTNYAVEAYQKKPATDLLAVTNKHHNTLVVALKESGLFNKRLHNIDDCKQELGSKTIKQLLGDANTKRTTLRQELTKKTQAPAQNTTDTTARI